VNVYDFDGTIYDGDSSLDFWRYCLKNKPVKSVYFLALILATVLYSLGFYSKEQFKSKFFACVKSLADTEQTVREFWYTHRKKIKTFYLDEHKTLDERKAGEVIISASPEFLLRPLCDEWGVTLIASRASPRTGEWLGTNCHGAEKVNRFRAMFPDVVVARFYSDTLSDEPMAALAKSAFLVKGRRIIPWGEYKPSFASKVKRTYFSRKFISFVFCGVIGSITAITVSAFSSLIIDPTIAYFIGYAVGLIPAYVLSGLLTYRLALKQLSFTQFGRFCVSYTPSLCILVGFVGVCINLLGWNNIFVYALAACLSVPLTFVLTKWFAFGKHNNNNLKQPKQRGIFK
jgi:phosphoserine phosphatase/putative flippase GtrA